MAFYMKKGLSEEAIIAFLCGEFGGIGTAILQNAMLATPLEDSKPEIKTCLQESMNPITHEVTNPEIKIISQEVKISLSCEGTAQEIKNQSGVDEGPPQKDSAETGEPGLFPGPHTLLGWHMDIRNTDETLNWVVDTAIVASVLETIHNSI